MTPFSSYDDVSDGFWGQRRDNKLYCFYMHLELENLISTPKYPRVIYLHYCTSILEILNTHFQQQPTAVPEGREGFDRPQWTINPTSLPSRTV